MKFLGRALLLCALIAQLPPSHSRDAAGAVGARRMDDTARYLRAQADSILKDSLMEDIEESKNENSNENSRNENSPTEAVLLDAPFLSPMNSENGSRNSEERMQEDQLHQMNVEALHRESPPRTAGGDSGACTTVNNTVLSRASRPPGRHPLKDLRDGSPKPTQSLQKPQKGKKRTAVISNSAKKDLSSSKTKLLLSSAPKFRKFAKLATSTANTTLNTAPVTPRTNGASAPLKQIRYVDQKEIIPKDFSTRLIACNRRPDNVDVWRDGVGLEHHSLACCRRKSDSGNDYSGQQQGSSTMSTSRKMKVSSRESGGGANQLPGTLKKIKLNTALGAKSGTSSNVGMKKFFKVLGSKDGRLIDSRKVAGRVNADGSSSGGPGANSAIGNLRGSKIVRTAGKIGGTNLTSTRTSWSGLSHLNLERLNILSTPKHATPKTTTRRTTERGSVESGAEETPFRLPETKKKLTLKSSWSRAPRLSEHRKGQLQVGRRSGSTLEQMSKKKMKRSSNCFKSCKRDGKLKAGKFAHSVSTLNRSIEESRKRYETVNCNFNFGCFEVFNSRNDLDGNHIHNGYIYDPRASAATMQLGNNASLHRNLHEIELASSDLHTPTPARRLSLEKRSLTHAALLTSSAVEAAVAVSRATEKLKEQLDRLEISMSHRSNEKEKGEEEKNNIVHRPPKYQESRKMIIDGKEDVNVRTSEVRLTKAKKSEV